MKTINIKGKEYIPVVERIKEFHIQYPKGWIDTDAISLGNLVLCEDKTLLDYEKRVTVRARVHLGDGRTFTGWSQAEYGKGMMGNVALEVAETSAVGRALGFANLGLTEGIASADEMRKVNQKSDDDSDLPF